uniref:DA-P36 family member n=1 Tax=Rhipicephalus zambeziensis TaxID=60191 RepID=A0A224YE03_9ACAR
MKAIIPVALLVLVFLNTPSEGADVPDVQYTYDISRMVNLTKNAAELIERMTGSKLKNLTFTGGNRFIEEPPVTSEVRPLIYGDGCNETTGFHNPNCKELFNWEIDDGIVTPLNISVNVTVQVVSKGESKTLHLNLDGASNITWSPETEDQEDRIVRTAIVQQECRFSAETIFTGFIYYEVDPKHIRGDRPASDTVNVVFLENDKEGLEERGKSLVYNVTGKYRHQLICAGETVTQ